MDRKTIEDKIRQVIVDTLDLPTDECVPEAILQTDPLGLIQLAMQLEFKFGIELDENAFVKIGTVRDVYNLVTSKLGGL